MKSKDIMMESIADLMWTAEDEEVSPNGCIHQLLIDCDGGPPLPPFKPLLGPAQGCKPPLGL